MPVIDLSSPVDADFWEPDDVTHERTSPSEGAAHMCSEMYEHLGLELSPSDLPGGEFLNNDTFTLTVHTGTHVDAPAHYGSSAEYGTPRTIDQMPLDWFHRPGMVLDLREHPPGVVGAPEIERALDAVGRRPDPFDIVLLHTGADRHVGTPSYFTEFVGLDGAAVDLLLDLGVRVIGTDAFSLDAPFPKIIERWRATGDSAVLWPAHMVGRRREYCQIERLAGLGALPVADGFTVSCFPVRLRGAGAGWTRAVALLGD